MANMAKHVLEPSFTFPVENESLNEQMLSTGEIKGSRIALQYMLETVLGSSNVYFQPPETLKMNYPCIVYSRDDISSDYANNAIYNNHKRYQVIVIDDDPDSTIPDEMLKLPMCKFNKHYTADNLNHDVFSIYY